MKEELVSVISPCYNGEKYLKPFIESLLSQDYSNVEFIIVNDGSTDNTERIILSYKEKLENKGWQVHYIFQENKGQAAALNQGLGIFKGKYLMWVDSDDILKTNNISKKVEFLQNHPECGMVICKTEVVNENDLSKRVGILQRHIKNSQKDNLFEDLITGFNVYYPPGGYMVTREAFESSIPKKQIYESSIGQNWQMMLPIAYNYKCGYINEILFKYVVRKESHSRIGNQGEELIKKIKEREHTIIKVIEEISMTNNSKQNYYKLNDDKAIKDECEKELNTNGKLTLKEKIIYYSTKGKIMKLICKILYIVIRLVERIQKKILIYI